MVIVYPLFCVPVYGNSTPAVLCSYVCGNSTPVVLCSSVYGNSTPVVLDTNCVVTVFISSATWAAPLCLGVLTKCLYPRGGRGQ